MGIPGARFRGDQRIRCSSFRARSFLPAFWRRWFRGPDRGGFTVLLQPSFAMIAPVIWVVVAAPSSMALGPPRSLSMS